MILKRWKRESIVEVEKLKQGIKLIQEGNKLLEHGSFDYYADKLLACYDLLIERFSPYKVGDRVRLNKTPHISASDSWGWMGAKHFLVEGAVAVVRSVEADGEGFSYLLAFDDESWINSHTKEVNPLSANDRGLYGFREKWLKPATPSPKDSKHD